MGAEGIDLETWNFACDTLVPPLVQEKYEIVPRPPLPVIFGKNSKNFISKFSARRSRDTGPMHKIKIVEKVHISCTEKISAWSDEGFRSYEIFKTADSYT